MSRYSDRLEKLEARAHPGGGVVVTTWHNSADDERVEKAQQQADAQGTLLVILHKFSETDYSSMREGASDAA